MPSRRGALQLIWLIPLLAAVIGGWLAVRAILERGPVVTITFATAEGIEPDKTRIKYRNVDIGRVTALTFSADRTRVVATAELSKQAENFLVADTRFWVVRPRISLSQISGLGTLLSGAYIGVDVGTSPESQRDFVGLDQPPAVTVDLPGRQFVLKAAELSSVDLGTPVLFRRVPVGQVIATELEADGRGAVVRIFVNAPFDRHVTPATRFWTTSGVDVTLAASGVRVNTESLASILVGGIAFQTPDDAAAAPPAADGTTFDLHGDRVSALRQPDAGEERYELRFVDSVRGLSPGAPVDFRGLVVGEVAEIGTHVDAGGEEVTIPVRIRLFPQRLNGGRGTATAGLMDKLVARGLRAQLRSGSLVTGQLYVALDFFPDAPAAKLRRADGVARLPTMPGTLQELQATLLAVARKVERLPLAELSADARAALQATTRTLAGIDAAVARVDGELAPKAGEAMVALTQTLASLDRTLARADRVLADDAPLQRDIRDALREVARAAEAMRSLADYVERNPAALLRGRPGEGEE